MPPMRMPKGGPRKAKDPKKTAARLLKYLEQYKLTMILVVLCIIVSAIAMAAGSASLGDLVDDYIKPMLSQASPDYSPLLKYLCFMGGLYLLGIVSPSCTTTSWSKLARAPRSASVTRCSPTCRPCPSASSTPIPWAT